MPVAFALFMAAHAGPPPASVDPPTCGERDPVAESRLALAAAADQADRKGGPTEGLAARDVGRLATVHALIQAGRICTSEAALNAAIVLQHSRTTEDHRLGFRLSTWAASQGLERAKRWAALAWDRGLVSGGEPQWYGSQAVSYEFVGPPAHGAAGGLAWCLVEIDPLATDQQRVAAGMSPLHDRLRWIYKRNSLAVPEEDLGMDRAWRDGVICPPSAWIRR